MRVFFILAAAAVLATAALGAEPCRVNPTYAKLDFWVGDWVVKLANGAVAGTNRIERVLGGCAVTEDWSGSRGGHGRSLFYVDAASGTWKQVWVTDRGAMKEKRLVEERPGGALRFQGEVAAAGGGTVLDRTTLTPLEGGKVRQVIEVSRDGGSTWSTMFDAVYERR